MLLALLLSELVSSERRLASVMGNALLLSIAQTKCPLQALNSAALAWFIAGEYPKHPQSILIEGKFSILFICLVGLYLVKEPSFA
jgi:hypothetical protein